VVKPVLGEVWAWVPHWVFASNVYEGVIESHSPLMNSSNLLPTWKRGIGETISMGTARRVDESEASSRKNVTVHQEY